MMGSVEKATTADISTSDFSNILTAIKKKFEIISCTWTEGKSFEVKFRTEMERNSNDYNKLCDNWVDIFSDVTNTVWAKKTSNTGPKVKFRKQYQCWTHGGREIKKELLFDPRKCKGTLDIKVLSDISPSSRRKNKFLRLGLNVVVKINFLHLHNVNLEDPYAFFVHNCKAQAEAPKQIFVNEKLPQLVSEMLKKGLDSSNFQNQSKINVPVMNNIVQPPTIMTEKSEELKEGKRIEDIPIQLCQSISESTLEKNDFIQDTLQMNPVQTFQLIQNVPIQNIKFEFQPGLEQFAQILVNDSNEPMICQPLLFDNVQSLPHFVQLNSRPMCNQNQSQFLQ